MGLLVLEHLVLLLHLIGFAALLGGVLVQLRARPPEVSSAMLHGALTVLVTGVVLVVIIQLGPEAVSGGGAWAKLGVKTAVALLVAVLVLANRRFSEIPRGLLVLIGIATVADAAVAVLWV